MRFHDAYRYEYHYRPAAFTLVEVLVVLVLISILASMVLTAISGVTQTAAQARTRSIIATIDSVIQERWESYKYRPLAVDTPSLNTSLPSGVFSREVLASEAARVRLNMIRDLQRMELPDRRADFQLVGAGGSVVNSPLLVFGMASLVKDTGTRIARDSVLANRTAVNISWSAPSVFSSYERLTRNANPNWHEQHEGAECLYMVMATSFIDGVPALELIPSNYIGDVDDDGMPEILDGWGQPIEFIRWPSGLVDPSDSSRPDDFDPLHSDYSFAANSILPSTWSMRPMVISAGADREFGVKLRADVRFRYNSNVAASGPDLRIMGWPLSSAGPYLGDEQAGSRPTPNWFFVDPFMRTLPEGSVVRLVAPHEKPGYLENSSFAADNITNYQLTAE